MKRVLREKLSLSQTKHLAQLASRLVQETDPGYGPADVDALMAVESVVYDIERIIYRQPERR